MPQIENHSENSTQELQLVFEGCHQPEINAYRACFGKTSFV